MLSPGGDATSTPLSRECSRRREDVPTREAERAGGCSGARALAPRAAPEVNPGPESGAAPLRLAWLGPGDLDDASRAALLRCALPYGKCNAPHARATLPHALPVIQNSSFQATKRPFNPFLAPGKQRLPLLLQAISFCPHVPDPVPNDCQA